LMDDTYVTKDKVKSLVFCTGKFYYDLLERREENGREDVALVRIEQLFPLPKKQLEEIISTYPKVTDYVWAQEEPRNMGAWGFMLMNFDLVKLRIASRRVYSSPAAGSSARSKARHKEVIDSVFDTPDK
ncbi:MAG: 2-oxoglutarate dehydrogenase E1 component, partial [Bacteroidia bacterium]|nr:2-oxoglutarate dehydrogenase E1 component [Bacteroidia bacterium]